MNTLPPIKEIQTEGARLHSLGLTTSPSIHISIKTGNVEFWTHSPCDYGAVYSETLLGLESGLREYKEDYSPANQLKKEAAKLGYKLVKEESK